MAFALSDTRPLRPVYTVEELAAEFGCHPDSVRNWIRRGWITPLKIGRLVRIPGSEVARFLSQGVPR